MGWDDVLEQKDTAVTPAFFMAYMLAKGYA